MLSILKRIIPKLLRNTRQCRNMSAGDLTSWPVELYGCDNLVIPEVVCPPGCTTTRKGLVLGIYCDSNPNKQSKALFTATAEKFNNITNGKLLRMLQICGSVPALGDTRIFFDVSKDFPILVITGLGSECFAYSEEEVRDESKEVIRIAAGVGCRVMQKLNVEKIYVESMGHAESAAEGSGMSIWIYQKYKNYCEKVHLPFLNLYDDCDYAGWNLGIQKAAAQNLCRYLAELPPNHLTPNKFAQVAVDLLCRAGVNVEVKVEGWAESHMMGGFMATSKGSCESPVFLEMTYYGGGCNCRPLIMVGKGMTYDSGGLSLLDCDNLHVKRGCMEGAASVVACMRAAALLKLPINIRGLVPVAENMPGCGAVKMGDIVTTADGRSLKLDDPLYLGSIMVGEALAYARHHSPRILLDIGNMGPGLSECTGQACTACFTNSDHLWGYMKLASAHSGDRVWRYPLWSIYNRHVMSSTSVDIEQIGKMGSREGNPCVMAAFLKQYACEFDWIHLDTYGVLLAKEDEDLYLRTGFSGRPVRTLIEFLYQLLENEAL